MTRSRPGLLAVVVSMGLIVVLAGLNLSTASSTRGQIISFVLGGVALIIGVAALALFFRDRSRPRDERGS